MLNQKVSVHFNDGRVEETFLTQYELAQFERWAVKQGLSASRPGRILIEDTPILWMRHGAWTACNRTASVKVSFDAWDVTVSSVEAETSPVPDPTQPGTQDAI